MGSKTGKIFERLLVALGASIALYTSASPHLALGAPASCYKLEELIIDTFANTAPNPNHRSCNINCASNATRVINSTATLQRNNCTNAITVATNRIRELNNLDSVLPGGGCESRTTGTDSSSRELTLICDCKATFKTFSPPAGMEAACGSNSSSSSSSSSSAASSSSTTSASSGSSGATATSGASNGSGGSATTASSTGANGCTPPATGGAAPSSIAAPCSPPADPANPASWTGLNSCPTLFGGMSFDGVQGRGFAALLRGTIKDNVDRTSKLPARSGVRPCALVANPLIKKDGFIFLEERTNRYGETCGEPMEPIVLTNPLTIMFDRRRPRGTLEDSWLMGAQYQAAAFFLNEVTQEAIAAKKIDIKQTAGGKSYCSKMAEGHQELRAKFDWMIEEIRGRKDFAEIAEQTVDCKKVLSRTASSTEFGTDQIAVRVCSVRMALEKSFLNIAACESLGRAEDSFLTKVASKPARDALYLWLRNTMKVACSYCQTAVCASQCYRNQVGAQMRTRLSTFWALTIPSEEFSSGGGAGSGGTDGSSNPELDSSLPSALGDYLACHKEGGVPLIFLGLLPIFGRRRRKRCSDKPVALALLTAAIIVAGCRDKIDQNTPTVLMTDPSEERCPFNLPAFSPACCSSDGTFNPDACEDPNTLLTDAITSTLMNGADALDSGLGSFTNGLDLLCLKEEVTVTGAGIGLTQGSWSNAPGASSSSGLSESSGNSDLSGGSSETTVASTATGSGPGAIPSIIGGGIDGGNPIETNTSGGSGPDREGPNSAALAAPSGSLFSAVGEDKTKLANKDSFLNKIGDRIASALGMNGGVPSGGDGGSAGFGSGSPRSADSSAARGGDSSTKGGGADSTTPLSGGVSLGMGGAMSGPGGGDGAVGGRDLANQQAWEKGAPSDAGGPTSMSKDPSDYFSRIGMDDSLFRVVTKRYRQKNIDWVRGKR